MDLSWGVLELEAIVIIIRVYCWLTTSLSPPYQTCLHTGIFKDIPVCSTIISNLTHINPWEPHQSYQPFTFKSHLLLTLFLYFILQKFSSLEVPVDTVSCVAHVYLFTLLSTSVTRGESASLRFLASFSIFFWPPATFLSKAHLAFHTAVICPIYKPYIHSCVLALKLSLSSIFEHRINLISMLPTIAPACFAVTYFSHICMLIVFFRRI